MLNIFFLLMDRNVNTYNYNNNRIDMEMWRYIFFCFVYTKRYEVAAAHDTFTSEVLGSRICSGALNLVDTVVVVTVAVTVAGTVACAGGVSTVDISLDPTYSISKIEKKKKNV